MTEQEKFVEWYGEPSENKVAMTVAAMALESWKERASRDFTNSKEMAFVVKTLESAKDWLTDRNSPHLLRLQVDEALAAIESQRSEGKSS